MSNSASWNIDRTWIDAPEPATRIVNMNQLGRALTEYTDPPVNVLFVYNCNPAATVPDQRRILRGLEREDLFTVVFEQVMTDTALYADVVLPATTFLEGYDFAKGYGPISLDLGRPVVDAVGEARSNADVFGELCARLGLLTGRRAERRARPDGPRARPPAGTDRRPAARRPHAGAAVRAGAGSVRRRVSEHRRIGRSISSPPRSKPRRRSGCIGSSRIRRPSAIRWRSSRRPASARSARRSASCRGRTSSC